MKPARRPATYEDVLAAPEHVVAELVDGELFTSPRPASPHARTLLRIAGELDRLMGGPPGASGLPGGWQILAEPELHLGADVVVPDVAGWRRARMPRMPDVPFFDLVPDWVCEVASPSTAALDRRRKMPVYARAGVAHLWLVDPLVKTLEVFQLVAEHDPPTWLLGCTHGGTEVVRAEPFAAIEFDLARWWSDAD